MAERPIDKKPRVPMTRRLMQVYAALLYNADLRGFLRGSIHTGKTKALCVPGLNCYSCPGAVGACPLGALQNALAASGHRAGWYVFGILLLFGVVLGRAVCGWLCPMGLLQELLDRIPTFKVRKSRVTSALSLVKYAVLVIFVLAVPLYWGLAKGMPLPAFCKFICPAGTLEGAVALLAHPGNDGLYGQLGVLFTRKFTILAVLALACVFCYRAFCRFVCPLGAFYGLFERFSVVGMRVDAGRCDGCGACVRLCRMDVRRVGDRECISCGDCVHVCPHGAISLKAGKWIVLGPRRDLKDAEAAKKRANAGRLAWGILLAMLVFALVWFNLLSPSARGESAPDTPAQTHAAEPGVAEPDPAEQRPAPGTTEAEAAPAAPDGEPDAARTEGPEAAPQQDAPAPTGAPDAEPSSSPEAPFPDAAAAGIPEGNGPGERMADFACTLLDGTEFRLSEQRGRIVFINQWATYCNPCVAELPYFESLAEEHPDVVILAFHQFPEASPSARAFLESRGWLGSWNVLFAVDGDNTALRAIGGTNTMPRTAVLDRNGVVVWNEERSVTREMLERLLEMAEESAPGA